MVVVDAVVIDQDLDTITGVARGPGLRGPYGLQVPLSLVVRVWQRVVAFRACVGVVVGVTGNSGVATQIKRRPRRHVVLRRAYEVGGAPDAAALGAWCAGHVVVAARMGCPEEQ